MGVLVAQHHPSVSAFPGPTAVSALHIDLFEACSAFTHVAAYTLARPPIRGRYPKASDTSSPSCLLRLLPAGAGAGRGLHPLEKRRLFTAHVKGSPSLRPIGMTRAPKVDILCHTATGCIRTSPAGRVTAANRRAKGLDTRACANDSQEE